MAALDQFQTIVIVMMENRSFDHLLGHLSIAVDFARYCFQWLHGPHIDIATAVREVCGHAGL